MTGEHHAHDAFDPHLDQARWAPRLGRILGEMRELQRQLEDLGDRQSVLVESGDLESLVGLLAERQAVVDRLNDAGERLAPFTRRWTELLGVVEPERASAFAHAAADIAASMSRLAERDEADRMRLEALRASIASEMNSVSRGRSALAAYGESMPGGPRYQDRQG